MSEFKIKQGDRYPIFQTTLSDNNGPVDLTNATTVNLLLKKRPAGSLLTKAATFVDKPTGVVEYAWAATDTDTIGIFDAEWEVTFTGGQKMTFPNSGYDVVNIYPQLV